MSENTGFTLDTSGAIERGEAYGGRRAGHGRAHDRPRLTLIPKPEHPR